MKKNSMAKPIDKYVGSRVRQRRIILGMNQSNLGEAIGLTFQQVQKYESGANRIGSGRLFQIAQALKIPVSYFFDNIPRELSNMVVGEIVDEVSNEINDKLNKKETLNLVRNYYEIEDVAIRKNVYNLVKSLV